jgi:hypothetical protein
LHHHYITEGRHRMTYYNGNPYASPTVAAPLDKFAHDDCLPADQFEPVVINGAATGERQQRSPWHWSPVWGAPEPCYVCTRPVR